METDLAENLRILDRTAQTLNRAVDVQSVLDNALVQLVRLMGMETGWIMLRDPAEPSFDGDSDYRLAAHHNLPPALGTGQADAWTGTCECQELCSRGKMARALAGKLSIAARADFFGKRDISKELLADLGKRAKQLKKD